MAGPVVDTVVSVVDEADQIIPDIIPGWSWAVSGVDDAPAGSEKSVTTMALPIAQASFVESCDQRSCVMTDSGDKGRINRPGHRFVLNLK